MTETSADLEAVAPKRATPFWLDLTIAIVVGLFYAYDVWEAVGNLVGLTDTTTQLDVPFTAWGLALLIAGIVLPLIVFALAFWIGRGRGVLAQLAVYVVGYALVQVLEADIASFFTLGGIDFG
ncbi:hypothetical protein ET445_10450 [Agromyces protaetiae]|uniref:Uncharacterized protein n=1 Tax=Agromyces protaetiae TaxID=2509455 RepID=A0A4P6FCT7_9MICO|nr:hypothetical protein [Agromyces protaetiae]QAY73704.1 hypothetical protein ET445_10450 [Agromyces protaetiae]